MQNEDRSWFRAQLTNDDEAEISIYDEIGLWGVSAKDFRDELRALGPVTAIALSINSPGGSIFDGYAIYNMLRRHKATINVTIDGIAASMASVIAMAGDSVVMPANAMMMIHDPSGLVVGTSKEMRELAAALDKIKQGMVSAYADKSGSDRGEIARLMAEETWFDADEAVELGLADDIEEPVSMAASFDLRRYSNVPKGFLGKEKRPMADKQRPKPTAADNNTPPPADTNENGGAPSPAAPADNAPAPAPAAATAATAATSTADGITADGIRAEERKRSADVMAACNLAGRNDLAAGFVAEGKSLSEVVAELQQQRANGASDGSSAGDARGTASAAGEINTRNGGSGNKGGAMRVDLTADMRKRAGLKEGA